MTKTIRQFKTNLNCGSCVAAVRPLLNSDPAIEHWAVDTDDPNKVLTVEGDSISIEQLQSHLRASGFRVLDEVSPTEQSETWERPQSVGGLRLNEPEKNANANANANGAETKKFNPQDLLGGELKSARASFLQTYRPLLLVIGYLIGVVGLVELSLGSVSWMRAMNHFMGGFFLAFSFFKFLDLRGFANSFQTYDIVAKPFRFYAFGYPFIELGLGVAYLANLVPIATNLITLVIMLVGIVGVTETLVKKRSIQCACLGTVFNLPMSKVTFFENGVMAAMAAVMVWHLI